MSKLETQYACPECNTSQLACECCMKELIGELYDLCEDLISLDMAGGAYTVADSYTESTQAMDKAEKVLGL